MSSRICSGGTTVQREIDRDALALEFLGHLLCELAVVAVAIDKDVHRHVRHASGRPRLVLACPSWTTMRLNSSIGLAIALLDESAVPVVGDRRGIECAIAPAQRAYPAGTGQPREGGPEACGPASKGISEPREALSN